ncbi:MAG: tRNA uridine-5-carboxymethylaminomethyl(34) synthesis GTPase MnmE [Sulfurospirillaceae bacterium]|nr:tRNA uridine-5-carboxymethylaminomethyl(34) synthesis GTPase MnmE [Sulfurospirillaceae bacterium]
MDTISAIATAHGVGSIAVVRVSGPNSLHIAQKITKKEKFTPRYASKLTLYDDSGSVIDESIVIYFKGPNSFTAEDIVEFQCHGGIVVADMILDAVIKNGARLAEPGEFSKRAFLNGKIDLTEAEAIAKIIETKSIDAAKILARQMRGELKEFVEKIRDDLVDVLAYVEASIDYAEEDLPQDLLQQIEAKLKKLEDLLKTTYDNSKRREGLVEGFRVAIVGKPNVGKSSLLNSLLSYDRAIISDIAGTTRDTIEEEVRIGTHLIKIVDTAGIRESNDLVENIGIDRSKKAIESSDIVIALFDNSREFDAEDRVILDILKECPEDKHIIQALNKKDLPAKFDISNIEGDFIEISSIYDNTLILDKLKKLLDSSSNDDSILLTSKRQMRAIDMTIEAIEQSRHVLNEGELEIFAFHLNEAIGSMSSITTNFDRDEILEKMFGSFCLGK